MHFPSEIVDAVVAGAVFSKLYYNMFSTGIWLESSVCGISSYLRAENNML